MCCGCGGGFNPLTDGIVFAAKHMEQDSFLSKYLPKDIDYKNYAVIVVFGLPSLIILVLTSPFLLLLEVCGANFLFKNNKIVHEHFINEILPLCVGLLLTLTVSCMIIKARNAKKIQDDYQTAPSN